MALSVRTRFEVFKRDDFTCQYCGQKSPTVILEVDHIHPESRGGSDDVMNLVTSCYDCNRGKSNVLLNAVMTGEDPHDKAIMIVERERQLAEYNHVIAYERDRCEQQAWNLWAYWQRERGFTSDEEMSTAPRPDIRWLRYAVKTCPQEMIRDFMDLALAKDMTKGLRYVNACVRNWVYARQATIDMEKDSMNSQ